MKITESQRSKEKRQIKHKTSGRLRIPFFVTCILRQPNFRYFFVFFFVFRIFLGLQHILCDHGLLRQRVNVRTTTTTTTERARATTSQNSEKKTFLVGEPEQTNHKSALRKAEAVCRTRRIHRLGSVLTRLPFPLCFRITCSTPENSENANKQKQAFPRRGGGETYVTRTREIW